MPGPMEARRRLGKRKMGCMSNYTPTQGFAPASLWGLFGQVDNTRWRWEAPTPRGAEKEAPAPKAPSLLGSLITRFTSSQKAFQEAAQEATKEAAEGNSDVAEIFEQSTHCNANSTSIRKETHILLKSIQEAGPKEKEIICQKYIELLKRSLELGLVSGEDLEAALFSVTHGFRGRRPVSFKQREHDDSICFSFYTNIWEGITSCKVVKPTDFDGAVMNRLMLCLSELSLTNSVRSFATRVIRHLSAAQLLKMESGLKILIIDVWLKDWLPGRVDLLNPYFSEAQNILQNIENSLEQVKQSTEEITRSSFGGGSDCAIANASMIIQDIRGDMAAATEAIATIEENFRFIHLEISALVETLKPLPHVLVESISTIIVKDSCTSGTFEEALHFYWLVVVSQLPNISLQTFLAAWQRTYSNRFFPQRVMGLILFNYWTSQRIIHDPIPIRSTYNATKGELGELLYAVGSHQENLSQTTQWLFDFLDEISAERLVLPTIQKLRSRGIYPPMAIMGPLFRKMSSYDPKIALQVYRHYRSDVHGYYPDPAKCPELFISMIYDNRICNKMIWKALEIYTYANMPKGKKYRFSRRVLSPGTIRLITNMATAFAESPAQTRSSAFRNVMNCLHHLRRHNAPITPQLSRAIVKAGIARNMADGLWVSPKRLEWILYMVEQVEGQQIRDEVEAITVAWDLRLQQGRASRRREQNVLRVGPID